MYPPVKFLYHLRCPSLFYLLISLSPEICSTPFMLIAPTDEPCDPPSPTKDISEDWDQTRLNSPLFFAILRQHTTVETTNQHRAATRSTGKIARSLPNNSNSNLAINSPLDSKLNSPTYSTSRSARPLCGLRKKLANHKIHATQYLLSLASL